jgi:hypothetical protein
VKRFARGSCLLLGVATFGVLFTPASAADPASPQPGYKLVWSDDFDYQGLPDPAKWGYEEGYVRNNESQFYTRVRQENARVNKRGKGTPWQDGRSREPKSVPGSLQMRTLGRKARP